MKKDKTKLSEFEEVMIYSSSCREVARNHQEEFREIKQRKTREARNAKLKAYLMKGRLSFWDKFFSRGEKHE